MKLMNTKFDLRNQKCSLNFHPQRIITMMNWLRSVAKEPSPNLDVFNITCVEEYWRHTWLFMDSEWSAEGWEPESHVILAGPKLSEPWKCQFVLASKCQMWQKSKWVLLLMCSGTVQTALFVKVRYLWPDGNCGILVKQSEISEEIS